MHLELLYFLFLFKYSEHSLAWLMVVYFLHSRIGGFSPQNPTYLTFSWTYFFYYKVNTTMVIFMVNNYGEQQQQIVENWKGGCHHLAHKLLVFGAFSCAQWVEDPAWSLQWLRSLRWRKFSPWPRNFPMGQGGEVGEGGKKRKPNLSTLMWSPLFPIHRTFFLELPYLTENIYVKTSCTIPAIE